jgi:ribosomal-protein-alanine N-acetyltransferase
LTRPAVMGICAGDLDRLAEMQAVCFADPWGAESFATTLSLPGVFALILRDTTPSGRMSVGFIVVQVVVDQADILTIGIVPGLRRRGYARLLLDAAIVRATVAGAKTMFLEVAEDNEAAIRLYVGCGFERMGRRIGYYRGGDGQKVAALTMRRSI